MVQISEVIEIDSSPEPSQSHFATPNGVGKSRDKGKGKATPRLTSSVIELTDSESDVENDKSRPIRPSNSVPGPSSPAPKVNSYTQPLQNGVLASSSGSAGASCSATSTSGSSPSRQKPAHPLFLADDEEHEPLLSAADITRVEVGVVDDAPPVEEPVPIPNPDAQTPAETDPQPSDTAPTSDLDPIQMEQVDPTSTAVAQILEIIPNVEPTHLLVLIETHLPVFSVFRVRHPDGGVLEEREATVDEQIQGVVGHVLHILFEDPNHPKVDLRAKGKGKRVAEDEDDNKGKRKEREDQGKRKEVVKKPKIDYASINRPFPGGPNYSDLALHHLQSSFPKIPKPYLRRRLQVHKSLYAPTHLSILAAEKSYDNNTNHRPYILKSGRTTLRIEKALQDVAFEEEKAWLDLELVGGGDKKEVDDAAMDDKDEEQAGDTLMDDAEDGEDDGTGIECQCCFADYPFSKMVQCPEAHLFCSTCISTYAATQLGTHNSSLTCIHPSSCSLPFPPSELQRILPVKLYELYERLEQQKEIMQAGLVGLEECPFCEWKCVLEVSSEEDKLFRCGNEEGGCGVVSCRGCKKLDHLPKSCKEAEEDKHLDGRHAIEEAMTRALMRNCPKCQKAFIKEQGCNKMSCPNCHTLSCYICRQVIQGYDHFENRHFTQATSSANAKNCVLWDPVEERHAQEVKEAAEKAIEEYKREHPDVDESAIKIDIPQVPNKVPAVGAPAIVPVINVFAGYPYNANPNPNYGQAHGYLHGAQPMPAPLVHQARGRHQHRQARVLPNTRARAAAEAANQPAQQPQRNVRAERARMAEQVRVRVAEEDNRARQRLDRVRDQRAAAKREQQERARAALELERERQRNQPQVQEPYQHRHVPLQQQPQQQPVMALVAQNPYARVGRARKRR